MNFRSSPDEVQYIVDREKDVIVTGGENVYSIEVEVEDALFSHLAGFTAPTSVEFRHELARSATGRLQKFMLRAEYWNATPEDSRIS